MLRSAFVLFLLLPAFAQAAAGGDITVTDVIGTPGGYGDESGLSIWQILYHRASVHPFHLFSLLMFVCAITHTFFTNMIRRYAHRVDEREKRNINAEQSSIMPEELATSRSFRVEILHFLGEVEIVFGIWVAPLLAGITYYADWNTAIRYLETRNYIEPFFVIVIMTLASTRPVLRFAESTLRRVAALGKHTPGAWWLTILTMGPVMGSLITEPGAMTISALLLSRKFYALDPSPRLRYATLGLLFVNISVGGVLTHFAAPPVLMVAGTWGWDTPFMLTHFGWKAVLGILISTGSYYIFFRKEFLQLNKREAKQKKTGKRKKLKIPLWITAFHLLALMWIVIHAHHPIVVIGAFFIFLGFYQATAPYQAPFTLRPALLVGFFLASLVIHGGMQAWWISPLLSKLSESFLMCLAIVLTAFNDNAAVTYLTTLIENFPPNLQYAVVAGAVAGGGLTVIANAPNPAGQSLLRRHFESGISPLHLFLSALFPTLVMALCLGLL